MVDEIKSVKKQVFKILASNLGISEGDEPKSVKDLLSVVAQIAGKGKDDVVNILCRETGVALAAMMKEPLNEVLESKKLQISFELVSKNDEDSSKTKKTSQKKKTVKKKKNS